MVSCARVENVGYTVHPGEMVALVGESGCGKSVSALAIMRLLAQTRRARHRAGASCSRAATC